MTCGRAICCPACSCLTRKITIGFALTETLEFVPAHFKIVVEELEKIACPKCEKAQTSLNISISSAASIQGQGAAH